MGKETDSSIQQAPTANIHPGIEFLTSLESFLTYSALGTFIADGVFRKELPNSIVLMRMFNRDITIINDALERLAGEGMIEIKEERLMGESAGKIVDRIAPYNHRTFPRQTT